jgi:hypothetical protein
MTDDKMRIAYIRGKNSNEGVSADDIDTLLAYIDKLEKEQREFYQKTQGANVYSTINLSDKKTTYVDKGKSYPETDDERFPISNLKSKTIASIKKDCNGFRFYGIDGKLMFSVCIDKIFDSHGNWFYDDAEWENLNYLRR